MRIVLTFLLAVSAAFASPAVAQDASASQPSRILFVTESAGFKHGSVNRKDNELAPAEIALKQLGQSSGLFTVDATQDVASDFIVENLKNYDIVAFYTTGNLDIADEARDYFFNEWLPTEGHGVLGFHSAADTYHNYEPYWDMIGGTFIGHAWNAPSTVTMRVHEPDNAIIKPFADAATEPADQNGDPGYVQQDEIYQYRHWQPEKVRVLMSLDYSGSPTGKGVPVQFGYHVPIAWIKNYGDGKVYFNNLGHREDTWTKQPVLDSIVTAVKWMRGEIEIDASPNPSVSAEQEAKAQADFEAGEFTKAEAKIK